MSNVITHILLVKYLPSYLPEGNLKTRLNLGRDFLLAGAVAPDLPYSVVNENDFYFTTKSELGDSFHYKRTNEIPLKALQMIKHKRDRLSRREETYLFAFFAGYISHIIADGIIHPFILDKVGDPKENKTAHRILEMQLNALIYYHLTESKEFSYFTIYNELKNFAANNYPETRKVADTFTELILDVYNVYYDGREIEKRIKNLYNLFDVADGEHPRVYKDVRLIGDFNFEDPSTLRTKYEHILTLTKPLTGKQNFLRTPCVNFLGDCVPHFYNTFIPTIEKAYNYIYDNGPNLNHYDIPAIDLETGREIAFSNHLEFMPSLWA